MATSKNQLGSLELPDTEPYRVVGVGATYLDATETIGPDGKPTIAYITRIAYRGETVELNEHQARRLVDLGAVKPKDEPLSYDEMKVDDLRSLADERGIDVQGSGADGGVLKEDLVNALATYDRGASATDAGVAVAASAPGGVTVSDERSQSGRRVPA